MPAEVDASTVETLEALSAIVSGARHFLVTVATTLSPGSDPPENEGPEAGAALLASSLRCIVADRIDPALTELKDLIVEWRPKGAPQEPGS